MVIGNRGETVEEKRQRHIKEIEESKLGWTYELRYAIEKKDEEYIRYCKIMIKIMENTLKTLKEF